MSSTDQRLTQALDLIAKEHGLPSLVVADDGGLLVAAATDADDREAVAAYAASRVAGVPQTPDMVKMRVKAREVSMRRGNLVVGAVGDTAICGVALARAAKDVQDVLDS